MWLNKKESSKGQRYFKIPEILRISRFLLLTKEVQFLVWGNPVQGKPFLTLTNTTTYIGDLWHVMHLNWVLFIELHPRAAECTKEGADRMVAMFDFSSHLFFCRGRELPIKGHWNLYGYGTFHDRGQTSPNDCRTVWERYCRLWACDATLRKSGRLL